MITTNVERRVKDDIGDPRRHDRRSRVQESGQPFVVGVMADERNEALSGA